MQSLPAGLLLLIYFTCSAATSCSNHPCDRSLCPRERFCPQGYTREPCGCCILCAKMEGERCGGLDNMYGSCGVGLTCNRSQYFHATSRGICQRLPGCIDYAGGGRYLMIGMTVQHACTRCKCKGDRQFYCHRVKTEQCKTVQPPDSGMPNIPQQPEPVTPQPLARGNDTSNLNDTEEYDLDQLISNAQEDTLPVLQDLFQNMFDE